MASFSCSLTYFVVVYFLITSLVLSEIQLSLKAASVCNSAFYFEYVTSVVWWQAENEEVTTFIKNFHGSTVTVPLDNDTKALSYLNKVTGFKQTVLFAISVEEFIHFITNVYWDIVVPIRMVLVLTKQTKDLSAITQVAWKHDVADFVIISTNDNKQIDISTYFPYKIGICGDISPQFISNEDELFPEKFANLYGCPLRATLIHFLPYLGLEKENGTIKSMFGIDGALLSILIEELNATMDCVSSIDHGGMGVLVNGTWKGSFGDIVRREADIFAPAGVITDKRYAVAQMSRTYETLNIHWCAPPRREIYAWAKVVLPFLTNITPFLILAFIVFALTVILVKRFKLRRANPNETVVLQTFTIFLGQGVNFETKSTTLNALFMSWIWFCLIVRIAYQGDLVNGLEKKILEPPLETVEQAIQELDGYGGSEVFREYYTGTPLADNYRALKITEIPLFLWNIAAGKRFVIATDVMMHQYSPIFQILKEPVTHSPRCLYMRPGWPVAKRFEDLSLRMMEVGISEQIMHIFQHIIRLKHRETGNESETKPLGMSTLYACFYSLAFLWILSFLIFIIEILYYSWKMKKFRNLNMRRIVFLRTNTKRFKFQH